MLNAVKYRSVLHACQSSFEFFYTLLCSVEVLLVCILEGCHSRGLLSEECSIHGQTHPLHT